MFTLSKAEWKHIKYLIDVTRQFSFWTINISTATGSRIGYIFNVYDELFKGLEECRRRLKPLLEA